MIYDPKRLDEDRTPSAPKDSPRVRDGVSVPSVVALSSGICSGCQESFQAGDKVTQFIPMGEDSPDRILAS